jgi:O-acetyl-ADP-ribose deacetylase (regulator of RNase III)
MSIKVVVGNIQELTGVNAIVNAANPQLRNGAGVCGAIFRAAGAEKLDAACQERMKDHPNGLPIGSVRLTDSFDLKNHEIKYILHAVGPDYRIPEQEAVGASLLMGTYENIFRLVRAYGIKSVAIPAISAGIYGCPIKVASTLAAYSAVQQERLAKEGVIPPVDIIFSVWEENRPFFESALERAHKSL